jgi:hypothetical protein
MTVNPASRLNLAGFSFFRLMADAVYSRVRYSNAMPTIIQYINGLSVLELLQHFAVIAGFALAWGAIASHSRENNE